MNEKRKKFVLTWMQAIKEGRNQSWVADQMDMSRQQVSAQAFTYRKAGIKLPLMKKGGSFLKESVTELNALIDEAK